MEHGGGRTPEQRRAASEARTRARAGAPEPGDEEFTEAAGGRRSPASMSRHYGGPDVYARRRLIAAGVGIAIVLLLLVFVVGC
jgi:hypothetical protein